MSENATFRPLVISKNKNIYRYDGNESYYNLSMRRGGIVSDEQAKNVFTIPPLLNQLAAENSNLVDLIEKLGLSYGGQEIYTGTLKFKK